MKEKSRTTWYHGTSVDNWNKIKDEGLLFGRRFIVDNDGNPIKEVDRCTYLAADKEEAECYGDVVLEVHYNPLNLKGKNRKDKRGKPCNNYVYGCWQMRVYEPILLEDISLIS